MSKKSFLNSLPVGIISILLAGLFGGLWYNANYKSNVLENYLDNPFFGGFNQQAKSEYEFYAKMYMILGIACLLFGVFVVMRFAKQKKG